MAQSTESRQARMPATLDGQRGSAADPRAARRRALGALLWALLTGAPLPAAAWGAGARAPVEERQAGLDARLQRALRGLPPAALPSTGALVGPCPTRPLRRPAA
jgi:hypothetical protein